jgi:membrane protein YqaA with SNARE-associated domain
MINRLTQFAQNFAQKPHALALLFVLALLEGFILPFPSDLLLITLVLSHPTHCWRYAVVNTIGTVCGGVIGYTIGRYGFHYVAVPLLDWACQYNDKLCSTVFMPELDHLFDVYGVWFIGLAAIAPVLPYKLGILFAGLAQMNIVSFIAVSLFARGLRYFMVAFVAHRYGRTVLAYVMKRFQFFCAGLAAGALVIVAAVNYF